MVFFFFFFLYVVLPFTLAGYFLIRRELRNAFLLIMSILFYAAGEPSFVRIMLLSVAANYLLGLLVWSLSKRNNRAVRAILLILTLFVNLGILFYYKYFDFAIGNINSIFSCNIPLKHIALPIGISFFTFQGMSYVLDVFMGKADVQKNPLNVALYIVLFPQLIAGPIVRYSDVSREISSRHENLADFTKGVQRFVIGLGKKAILSNAVAVLADTAFDMDPSELGCGMAWLGALAYAFQIYFDFSGYSDMAIGLGRMFGFHFLENFDYPYISKSVTVFWRKWHISLSSWFRDYVYIPIGGNRKGNVYLHLLTIFFLTGVWHGASWNFIFWGLWHGFFLIVERVLRNRKISVKCPSIFKRLYTMLVVLIGWVFFRAPSMYAGLSYLGCMFGASKVEAVSLETLFYAREYLVTFVIAAVCATPIAKKIDQLRAKHRAIEITATIIQPVAIILIFLMTIGILSVTTYNPFIYFNF